MSTTPFAARTPYIEAEAASLRISIVKMSEELMFFISVTGKPSTIYNGSLPPKAVPSPRITTVGEDPGASLLTIFTPEILP